MNRAVPLLLGAAIAAVAVGRKKRRRSTPQLPDGVSRAEILFFQAEWCPACKKAKPAIKTIAKRYSNIVFTNVDIEKEPERASAFSVTSIPAFVALVDGKEVDRREGFKDASDLETFVSKFAEQAIAGDEQRAIEGA